MDPGLAQLRERLRDAQAKQQPVRLRGAGTKDFYGNAFAGEVVDTRAYRGIVDYEPSELVIVARCGTPLAAIEATLQERDQCLAFEPPGFGGDPTLGGVIAAGLSGPRRMYAGAARDFVLGASLLTANGDLLTFGGRVMKNVAGFDLARVLCGSMGILGLITDVSLKVLPRARSEATHMLEVSPAEALDAFGRWRARPLPISGTAYVGGRLWVRLSGAMPAVKAACAVVGGEPLEDELAATFWEEIRQQTHATFRRPGPLWRICVPSSAPMLTLSGDCLLEWGGALRWYWTAAPVAEVRARAVGAGGTALLWRGEDQADRFHPLSAPVYEIHRRLKSRLDPRGLFNPGRLVAGL